ncbi:MAG TPA: monofunctional biosynthetic peptidoglycan transglycosylase [Syntrophales bacterium]|nr:monofunctional biosynthetic peptidoglycan transglycosylase [Syntrophales bacterium]
MKKIIKIAILVFAAALVSSIALYLIYPDVSKLKKVAPKKTAFMEYREKEWQEHGKKKKIVQQWVPLSQIPAYVIKAVIIAEDDKFWSHEGFDYEAMQKAIEKDIKKKKFALGGSTISQQLAKNLYLTPSKNPVRKIKEAILTWRLERNLSKRRIIELYLNCVEWGDAIFGIEAAAHHYYNKDVSELTAQEAARLAAVLPNPIRFNPTGTSKYVEARADRIYEIMVKRGVVIPEYEEMLNEPQKIEGEDDGSPQESSQQPASTSPPPKE